MGGDDCANYFTGEQESVTGSRQEVVGGFSTRKKRCHGEYVEATTRVTGQNKKIERKEDKGDEGSRASNSFFLLFCFRKRKCRKGESF